MLEINKNGDRFWYNENHKFHKDDGPACEYGNGTKCWYMNGKRYRVDGPAIEYFNGSKEWWINGELHRIYGPAIEWNDGMKEWYLHGRQYTEEEYRKKVGGIC